MRAVAVSLLLLAAPLAAADPYVVLVDWQEGSALVGTTALLEAPDAARWTFATDACHRYLLLDLLYDPSETRVDAGSAEAAVAHEFRAEVWSNGTLSGAARVRDPGHGAPLALVEEGEHELRVWLASGAGVAWELRVRARAPLDEAGCGSPG